MESQTLPLLNDGDAADEASSWTRVRQFIHPCGAPPAGSTISRELERNVDGQGRYRSTAAHALAYQRAGRPKLAKLAVNLALREKVEQDLENKYSPEQIVGRLLVEFPDDPQMRVSTETIDQSIYVQSRGAYAVTCGVSN